MTIFFKLVIKVFIKLRILTSLLNKDYLFEFNYTRIYAHTINADVSFIYIKNDVDIFKIVFRYFNLNIIVKYNVDLCLVIHLNDHDLITKIENWELTHWKTISISKWTTIFQYMIIIIKSSIWRSW